MSETELVFTELNSDDEEPLANFQQLRTDLQLVERKRRSNQGTKIRTRPATTARACHRPPGHCSERTQNLQAGLPSYLLETTVWYMKEETITHTGEGK